MLLTERGTAVILGRSDATINRSGVRLGSAEIYEAIGGMPDVEDALAVGVEQRRRWLLVPAVRRAARRRRCRRTSPTGSATGSGSGRRPATCPTT